LKFNVDVGTIMILMLKLLEH